MSTSASGRREIAAPRERVWRALAVLEPYCAVCDVSYVVDAGAPAGKGTTFVAVPGRLVDGGPPETAPRGEIVEWDPPRLVATRLTLTPEVWTTRIELVDTPRGTEVALTLTHEPRIRGRLGLRRARELRRLVQHTVDAELDKLPAHVAQIAG
jgi:Polyketide cyclase / dehydrase and lipid transport